MCFFLALTTLRHFATVACKHSFFSVLWENTTWNCLVWLWGQGGGTTQTQKKQNTKQQKKRGDPKQSQRQQTNSIIKAIGRLWTRKLHERLWGLDQWQSGLQIMLHCLEHQTNTRRFINGGSFTKRGAVATTNRRAAAGWRSRASDGRKSKRCLGWEDWDLNLR